ncbi:MAG: hypothetical protein EAX91_15355 [Candidatus Lokiarchaeota archaeon]|nr:hypothetical protein [Candidatus Lokiarchaeota archaeon]
MTNQNKVPSKTRAELESELFATVNTVLSLNQKYQGGNIKENFFQRSIKTAMNDLLKINLALNKENIDLSKLLDRMNIADKYYQAINVINKVSSLNISTDQLSKTTSSSMLEIPGLSSEITSSFITLMDALKLESFNNNEIIIDLFKTLKKNFDRFPGLELSKVKLAKIYQNFLKNNEKISTNRNFRNSIGENLYVVYKEFKEEINL